MRMYFVQIVIIATSFASMSCRTQALMDDMAQRPLLFQPVTNTACEPPFAHWHAPHDSLLMMIRNSRVVIDSTIYDTLRVDGAYSRHTIRCDDEYFHYLFYCDHLDSIPASEDNPTTGGHAEITANAIRDYVSCIVVSRHCATAAEAQSLFDVLFSWMSGMDGNYVAKSKTRRRTTRGNELADNSYQQGMRLDFERECRERKLTVRVYLWENDLEIEYRSKPLANL